MKRSETIMNMATDLIIELGVVVYLDYGTAQDIAEQLLLNMESSGIIKQWESEND